MTFRCFEKFLMSLSFTMVTFEVNAECFLCDEVITLNKEMVACLNSNFEEFTKEISEANGEPTALNLTSCYETGASSENTRSLSVLPSLSTSGKIKNVYMFDVDNLNCLIDLVKSNDLDFDPNVTLDLYEEC